MALACLTAPVLPVLAQPLGGSVVRACDDANEWPPYTFRRADGMLDGFTVQLLQRIARTQGWTLQLELLPWARCQDEVRRGERLLLLNAIRTPARDADFHLSRPIYETRLLYLWSRLRHPQGLRLTHPTELMQHRFAGLQGYSYGQMEAVDLSRMQRAPSYDSLLRMLHLGRADLMLINEGVLLGLRQQQREGFAAEDPIDFAPMPQREPSRFHVMSARQHPQGQALMQAIDTELEAMTRSGELSRLRERFGLARR